jgi:hypothetical protein
MLAEAVPLSELGFSDTYITVWPQYVYALSVYFQAAAAMYDLTLYSCLTLYLQSPEQYPRDLAAASSSSSSNSRQGIGGLLSPRSTHPFLRGEVTYLGIHEGDCPDPRAWAQHVTLTAATPGRLDMDISA